MHFIRFTSGAWFESPLGRCLPDIQITREYIEIADGRCPHYVTAFICNTQPLKGLSYSVRCNISSWRTFLAIQNQPPRIGIVDVTK